jgi:DNA-binding SARP family transcriptional activator
MRGNVRHAGFSSVCFPFELLAAQFGQSFLGRWDGFMLQLTVLGGLSLTRNGSVVEGGGQRRLAFLAVLACAAPSGGISRDRLLLLFWPEKTDAQARNALKQLTFALRRDLSATDLFLGTTELRLNEAAMTSDVGDLLRAAQGGDDRTVISLYCGPLLDAVYLGEAPEFERWLDDQL